MMQYGDYISLYQDVPRVFMPVFWVEQKFVLHADIARELRFALMLPSIGHYVGVILIIFGIIMMSFTRLRKLLCINKGKFEKAHDIYVKVDAEPLTKEQEMNPLMSIT